MGIISNRNAVNSVKGVLGLFSPLNKTIKKGEDDDEGLVSVIPEFESSMKDEDILTLTAEWVSAYDTYLNDKNIKAQQRDNFNYWIGKHYSDLQTAGTKRPVFDNLIFEAIETFLPIATRSTPEANVSTSDGQQSQLTRVVQPILNWQGERTRMRMKIKGAARDWILSLIGCLEIVWDTQLNDFDIKKVVPTRLILDVNAEIGVDGMYYGEFLGQKKKLSASKLEKMFPQKSSIITMLCDGNMGTKLQYVEWWTPTDLFFTIDGYVLGKYKNPHWNYDGEVDQIDNKTGETKKVFIKGKNHFNQPMIPYVFLSIFNLGKQPHDETSLVYQNIPLQDVINKRYQQIDRNVEAQNNGIVLSGSHFTKEQAAEAATQLSRGNPLWVPGGDIRAAYARDNAPQLPADVFNQLRDARNELRNIFGTSGSTPEGTKQQESVRGKILINQLDSSRIGGGITEYLELMATSLYNWFVQMMYVYYTETKEFPISQDKNKDQMVKIINTDFSSPVFVKVKTGSLVPKDPLTQRNEAMDLWSAQAIDPITLYEKLDYPNPYESAKELLKWKMIESGGLHPQVMFPDFQGPQQQVPGESQMVSQAESNEARDNTPVEAVGASRKQLLSSVPI